ncbi:MAG: hypothetical protein WA465_05195 [Methylovirgula sp.]
MKQRLPRKQKKIASSPRPVREPTAEERTKERQRRLEIAEDLRADMETASLRVRDLILAQPPTALLGYVWAQFYMAVLAERKQMDEDEDRPNKDIIQKFQFALEYVHAVWSSTAALFGVQASFDESKAKRLFEALDELKNSTMSYCMVSSAANIEPEGSHQSADTEFQAKTSWVLIRGNRYQVLEKEFFDFILKPHNEALLRAYSMDAGTIAEGIQAIADSVSMGFSDAVEKMFAGMEKTHAHMGAGNDDLAAAIDKMKEEDPNFAADMSQVMQDMFYGGICNVSRHAKLSAPLLEDLSYVPGGNVEFFADGEFKGTPMRTLPALIRPGIKLGNDYYITDGQFVRDAAYRAIQRGLIARLPDYREEWNKRQQTVTEESYPTIFTKQLSGAKKFAEIYFKDPKTGEWAETDLIMALADVLLVVEAKAGVQAMHSPATNFKSHERVVRNLIIKAYEQCKRFVGYLASAQEVPIFNLIDGEYVEIGKLRQRDFRLILPIGLTVEAFTPFSAMCKELSEIQPILDKHAFVSMSVDDLFVLNRFLPSTGELLHYLEVRQAVGGIKHAMIFDEIEHLGAYIRNNRFDMTIKEQLEKADMVTWDSFGDVVDRYFEERSWQTVPPPRQDYPEELVGIFVALDKYRPAGWLDVDAFIRSLGGQGRNDLAKYIGELRSTLTSFPTRRFVYGVNDPLQVWLCRAGSVPSQASLLRQGQIASLLSIGATVRVLVISYNSKLDIVATQCARAGAPSILQRNYSELLREAEEHRGRFISLNAKDRKNGKR